MAAGLAVGAGLAAVGLGVDLGLTVGLGVGVAVGLGVDSAAVVAVGVLSSIAPPQAARANSAMMSRAKEMIRAAMWDSLAA